MKSSFCNPIRRTGEKSVSATAEEQRFLPSIVLFGTDLNAHLPSGFHIAIWLVVEPPL